MSEYTPGKWFMSKTHRGENYDIGAPDGSNIALVNASETDGNVCDAATGRANACLIISAPELLDLAEEYLGLLIVSDTSVCPFDIVERTQEIIDKAKGDVS